MGKDIYRPLTVKPDSIVLIGTDGVEMLFKVNNKDRYFYVMCGCALYLDSTELNGEEYEQFWEYYETGEVVKWADRYWPQYAPHRKKEDVE